MNRQVVTSRAVVDDFQADVTHITNAKFITHDWQNTSYRAMVNSSSTVNDLFTIEEFGGWPKVSKELFGEDGKISKLLIEIKDSRSG